MRVCVVGAGIFGTSVSLILSKAGFDVVCLEARDDILMEASKINHNRIHLGYHYLRSKETARQSLEGLVSFLFYYGKSVICHFPNFYAVANEDSKTSPEDFTKFCDEIGISWKEEYPASKFLNQKKISACYRVPEPIFDYDILKKIVWEHLADSKVDLLLNTTCENIERNHKGYAVRHNSSISEFDAVVNASYRNFGVINNHLGIPNDTATYEDVIIPVFQYPHSQIGLTVMDGKYCSVMPHGNTKNNFLLYHVSQSVLRQDSETFSGTSPLSDKTIQELYNSSGEYYPFLNDAYHLRIQRTIRAKRENANDARVTDLKIHERNYISVLSGKVTTCISTALRIREELSGTTKHKYLI